MKRTIQIGDKYAELMKYYGKKYDKEEFNIFFTQLLVANKELEDREIDFLFLVDLIKRYNLSYYELMDLILKREVDPNKQVYAAPKKNNIVVEEPIIEKEEPIIEKEEKPIIKKDPVIKKEVKEEPITKEEVVIKKGKNVVPSNGEKSSNIEEEEENPFVRMGIDLS